MHQYIQGLKQCGVLKDSPSLDTMDEARIRQEINKVFKP